MSGAVFFTADTHVGHKFVAGLRGFATAEAHDEAIVENWNRVVGRDDTVWHLGDVTLRGIDQAAEVLAALNGTIHLVAGNHDACWPGHRDAHKAQRRYLERFASVQPFARRRIAGTNVLLSHFPYGGDHTDEPRYSQWRLRDEGLWLLHGHVHGAWRVRGRQFNVGLDVNGLSPVPLGVVDQLVSADQPESVPA